ncbi:TonB-dependent receptor plug domain-containing protein [Candidatus Sulfurimonas baltica]|uniref:TonB-dependent receptor n=1 Tax=Candidatus Sulfurimonas baltica TaxID=2740404 RepID=A0A7S7LVG8_9BACT|nr:TonB-dependent receptor [Candidatus Sulfurimonas baltica]QOY52201.1 TonB-dependent receptor [Candidatus Sulfurimonas baltica]
MYKKKILLSILASSILVAQEIELKQITVTSATTTTQSIEDVTSNLNVITAKEIEEKRYTTVVQALNSISGISFTSNGPIGQTSSVYLRGLSSKRTLVLIDGIRYNDLTGLSGAPFGDLMIGDIEQIEVIKGAQSGIWGADATAGVINIITKSAEKGAHASINVEYGSFSTKKYGVLASYKTDAYYIKASAQKIDSNGFSSLVPNGDDIDMYEDDGYKNTTSNIKLGFNFDENNKVDLSHTLIYSKVESDPFATPNGIENSITKDSFSQVNLNHKNDFTELDVYAKLSIFNRDYPQGWTKEFDGEVKEYGIKSNTAYNDDDFVVLGIDYKTFEHKNDLQEKYNNKAIFLTNSNEFTLLGGRTVLSESMRLDAYDKFDNKTTGKVGIKHFCKNIDGLVTSANIGSSYNVPTLYNLNDPTYGNKNLTPENTLSYDLSAEYKAFKITYFNSKTKDMIDFDLNTWKYFNATGETKIQGFEIEYNTKINEDISLTSNYTLLDAKNSDDKRLQRRPKNSLKLALDYYGVKDLHVGINGEYIGERHSSDDKQGTQTGKYTVVNFVTNYDINNNFSVYAKIDNLFDKYYQVVDGYATAPLSAYVGVNAKF